MNITSLELITKDLQKQYEFYSNILDLSVNLLSAKLEVQAGVTKLVFTKAETDFDGAYHFAFNIPANQYQAAKNWLSQRTPLLRNAEGKDEYDFPNWNAHAFYFSDPSGNVLEFIARHDLENTVNTPFDSQQILNVSEIGVPAEDVVAFSNELCTRLGLTVFRGKPDATFTPIGDDHGLFIIPVVGRLWMPTHQPGIPARLLPVKVTGNANGKEWELQGTPYKIIT